MGKLEVPEKSRSSSSGLTRKQLCTSCDACWPTSWANPTWQSNERTPYRSAVVAMGRVLGWVARCASGQRRKQRRRLRFFGKSASSGAVFLVSLRSRYMRQYVISSRPQGGLLRNSHQTREKTRNHTT